MAVIVGVAAGPPAALRAQTSPERLRASAFVILANGERIEGDVLNETFSLRTAYEEIKLPTRYIAEVRFPSSDHRLQTVLTVNSNSLTGFIEDSLVRIGLRERTQEVRRERLERLVFDRRNSEPTPSPQVQWIQLRNGDKLSGEVVSDSLALVENGTNSSIPFRDAGAIFLSSNQPANVMAQMHSGETRQGILAVEAVQFRLALGPALRLPAGLISWIGAYERGPENEPPHDPAVVEATARQGLLASVTNQAGWVWIQPGQFQMGSPTEEAGRDPDEGPQTRIVIPQGFWMSKYEVTQGEYQSVMGANPSNATGDAKRPVERVTWFEAVDFCRRLTEVIEEAGGLAKGCAYRLPTEAEWEYACRAGTITRFSFGEDRNGTQLGEYAWFTRNSDSATHPVGTRHSNPWGLYDMHGNVWEWCLDRWEDALPGGTITNKVVLATGTLRVARGGSWLYEPKACRSANRDDYSPWDRCSDIGFRIVLAPAL